MLIQKGDGTHEPFDPGKVLFSLKRAGAPDRLAGEIVKHVTREIKDGDSTSVIYRHAFRHLKDADRFLAARYSLRRAVMELGPSGFPFESFVAEIFRTKGYRTKTGIMMQGKCVSHEVDVVAETDTDFIAMEAKFHNKPGFKTDVKVALYVHSRFRDLEASKFDGMKKDSQKAHCWIITNTKFTQHAREYATCTGGVHLIGWDYPKKGNLEDLIEETQVHPLTCLTTLSETEKTDLFKQGVVLCRSLKEDTKSLKKLGMSDAKIAEVLEEGARVCVPRT